MALIQLPSVCSFLFLKADDCPTEQQLVEYIDQQLIGSERHEIEAHLTKCDKCLHQVGFLVKTDSVGAPVPPELLYTAKRLGRQKDPSVGILWRPAVAVAAFLLVAAISWFVGRRSAIGDTDQPLAVAQNRADVSSLSTQKAEPQDQVRGVAKPETPFLLNPAAGAIVDASTVVFQWKAVQSVEYYEITVVTESGDVVWKKRTSLTSTKLPSSIELQSTHSYYVWITARSSVLGLVRSVPVRFTAG